MQTNNLIGVFHYLNAFDGSGDRINCGASYNIFNGDFNPDSGYMVALEGYEKVVDMPTDLNRFQDVILNYLQARVWDGMNKEAGDIYIGFWINEGKLYIDLSERIINKHHAMRAGIRRNQKAIWDANKRQEIFLEWKPTVSNDSDITTDQKY
jgi:hypothetical protein